MEIPCKNCIVFPMCRIYAHPFKNIFHLSLLSQKCEKIKKYALSENGAFYMTNRGNVRFRTGSDIYKKLQYYYIHYKELGV